jgi:membrane-associated phospholipid phosphatase
VPPTWQVSVWFTESVGQYQVLDDFMQVLSSNYFAPQILSIVLWCIWFGTRNRERRWHNQKVLVAVTLGAILASMIAESFVLLQDKTGYFWERPYDSHPEAMKAMELLYFRLHDPSFPSNAICIFTAATVGVWFASHRASLALWGILLLWALGRIYVGIHYPVDIAGGIALGTIAALVARKLVQVFDTQVSYFLGLIRKLHLA